MKGLYKLLLSLWRNPFPVTQDKALRIAQKQIITTHGAPSIDNFHIYDGEPPNPIYGLTHNQIWSVVCPWDNHFSGVIQDSRLIVISKVSGQVLYDGSAQDEG